MEVRAWAGAAAAPPALLAEAVALAAADEAVRVAALLVARRVVAAQLARVRGRGGGQPGVHLGRLAHEIGQAVVHAQRAPDADHCAQAGRERSHFQSAKKR